MNIYKAFYKNQTIEVKADSSYHAQEAAVKELQKSYRKTVKGYDITIVLVSLDGINPVTHIADF